jgi:LuxR family maltose regulon positive regulatory protein
MSELHLEQGDTEAAAGQLQTAQRLGEQASLTDWQCRLCVAQARLKVAQGDLAGAVDLLDEAERQYVRNPVPEVRPIAALRARMWVRQGRWAEALAWAREQDLSVEDELSYLREYEHITLARALIARYRGDQEPGAIRQAMGLLDRLLAAAEDGGRMGRAVEILVLQALVLEAQGDIPGALDVLARTLTLAEPEGHVRVFVDEGPPMARLLGQLQRKGVAAGYVARLLAASEGATKDDADADIRRNAEPGPSSLVEPLSKRELEVLRLLGTELSGPEIARELVISLNTMRTHTKNIYGKLGVNNRRSAVRRAEELDLL